MVEKVSSDDLCHSNSAKCTSAFVSTTMERRTNVLRGRRLIRFLFNFGALHCAQQQQQQPLLQRNNNNCNTDRMMIHGFLVIFPFECTRSFS
mmetsp:Transcript_3668/g.5428  ORF Transcript_3668/g.5428 Transcript_3668/m.5428 type:complete len:92 (-) Transcript_3668:97-372(-)